jgi:hypothetical protein
VISWRHFSTLWTQASAGWMVNDLHRHRIFWLAALLAGIMRWHDIVKTGRALSIARSYRPDEWPDILSRVN